MWLFYVPHDQAAIRANAIVVLSGSDVRLPVGVRLARRGLAPLLIVSRNVRPTKLELRACAHRLAVRTVCVHADPFSTRGEARLIARLARARRWRAVDVVTSRFHDFRAGRMIRRCYHGRLAVVAAPNPGGVDLLKNLVLEPLKLAYHELIARGC